jgi:hypothetical protein
MSVWRLAVGARRPLTHPNSLRLQQLAPSQQPSAPSGKYQTR